MSESPSISVIIPTYNRPAQLARCLDALAACDAPPRGCEVIVIDDGGRESLEAVITPFLTRLDLIFIRQANAGPSAARNAGIARARGQFAAFIDDDCIPPRGWLVKLDACCARDPDAMIGGRVVNCLIDNPYSAFSQEITAIVYAWYNADADHARFLASNHMIVPLDGLRALGGFDAAMRFSEDRDLCDRWLFSGRRILYRHDLEMGHGHALTLRTYFQQHFSYGRGADGYHTARAARGSGTMREAAGFHADVHNWLIDPVRRAPGIGGKLRTLALIGLWQAANTLGYTLARLRRRA